MGGGWEVAVGLRWDAREGGGVGRWYSGTEERDDWE